MKQDAGQLLAAVVTKVCARGEEAMIFPMLSDIVCTLVPQVGVQSAPGEQDSLLGIIQTLVCSASDSPAKLVAIEKLPPFPRDTAVFEAMREVSKGKSLEGEVARFCEASEHVPTEVNKASLVQLHDQLRRARSTTVPNRPVQSCWY